MDSNMQRKYDLCRFYQANMWSANYYSTEPYLDQYLLFLQLSTCHMRCFLPLYANGNLNSISQHKLSFHSNTMTAVS